MADPFRASLLLIAAYLVHLAEEWIGDFPTWSRLVRGNGVSADEFLLINASFLALLGTLSVVANRRAGMAWYPATLAAIFVINAVLHTLATWRYGVYSPGTITGLVIYLPLGVMVLRKMRAQLSVNALTACLVAGALIHVFITFIAFR